MHLVSDDEERRINEILDKGIDEIQKSHSVLKSSITNSHLIDYKNSNYSNERRDEREMTHIDRTNLNNYADYNPDKENSEISYNTHSLLTNPSNPSQRSQAKSSALRQLLDEMKTNNKYATSSEDEGQFEARFRPVKFDNTTKINTDKVEYGIRDSHQPISNTLKHDSQSSGDEKQKKNAINKNYTCKDDILLYNNTSPREDVINESNLINSVNSRQKFTNENVTKHHPKGLSKNFKESLDLSQSNKPKPKFQDIKYDIKSLENKINGLEKKLFDSTSDFASDRHIDNFSKLKLPHKYNKYNKTLLNDNKSEDEIRNSLRMNRFRANHLVDINKSLNSTSSSKFRKHDNLISATPKRNYTSSLGSNRYNYNPTKNNSSNSRQSKHSNILTKTKEVLRGELSKPSNKTHNEFQQLQEYKTKYQKLKSDYDNLKCDLTKERQKYSGLERNYRKALKKEEQYDKLNENHNILNAKYLELLMRLDESELIRKEQARLIKSMQNEIDFVRTEAREDRIKNYEKLDTSKDTSQLAEEFKELKKDLKEAQKPLVKKKIKKKRSRSKVKELKV